MNKFSLYHTALYAKHWYKRGNIWEDLRKTLTMDNYSGEVMSKDDIVRVILNQCERIPETRAFHSLYEFAMGISPMECWKYGYYTKEHTWTRYCKSSPDYDYHEAIVRYCLSNISIRSYEELGCDKFPAPDFKKCLRKASRSITVKKINAVFS